MNSEAYVLELAAAVIDYQTVIEEPMYFVIADGRIQNWKIGHFIPKTPEESRIRVIRKPHRIAIPGLVNTHGHAAMTLLRGVGDDLPLMDWLQNRIFPMEGKFTEQAIYWGTQLAIWEMLISGTTAYTDMYMMMDNTARAVAETGIRGVLSVGVVDIDEASRLNGIRRSRDFVSSWNGAADGRILTTLGPHAPYTCSQEYLSELANLAGELNIPVQIHLSETRLEVENSYRDHGVSPIRFTQQSGLFGQKVLAAHCVHVDDEDIDLLNHYDVHVAHNPQSNLKLGSGVAPLAKFMDKEMTVGLGTDGAASNNNLDMFEEMRLAATLHKGILEDAQAIPANVAFHLATEAGAKASFLSDTAGSLRSGCAADIVLLDANSPHSLPRYNLISNVVYAFGADDVTDVFISGRHIVSNRVTLTIDTERVRYEVKQLMKLLQS